MKSTLRKILSGILVGTLCFSLTGCSIGKSSEKDITNSDGEGIKIMQTKAEDVAETFIDSLINEDYTRAGILLGTGSENSFFTSKDVEWYLPRSNFANTEKFKEAKYEITIVENSNDGTTSDITATVKTKSKDSITEKFKISLVRDNENKWFINSPDFYIENWNIVTPGGDTKVTIDNKHFSEEIEVKAYGSTGLRKEYTVEKIGKSEKTIKLIAENGFGEREFKVNPTENTLEEPYLCTVKLSDETPYKELEKIWNDCYKDICDGKQASDLISYISESADTNVATIMYNGISGADNSGSGKYSNFICSNVRPCSSADYMSHYLTDKVILLSFNYDMSWHYDSDYNMTNSTKVQLSFENGQYKIYNAGDAFFSRYSRFINKTN